MRHYKLEIADSFHRDLDRAAYYINDVLQNKRAAYRLTVKVKETLTNLQEMAIGYPLVRNDILAEKGFRWISVYNSDYFCAINKRLFLCLTEVGFCCIVISDVKREPVDSLVLA